MGSWGDAEEIKALTVLGSKSFWGIDTVIDTEEERDWNPCSHGGNISLVRHLRHPSAQLLPGSPRPGGSGSQPACMLKCKNILQGPPSEQLESPGVGPRR